MTGNFTCENAINEFLPFLPRDAL